MSEQNVEVVRDAIEILNRGFHGEVSPRFADVFAVDVEVDMSRRVFNPDVYEGHDGLRRLGREIGEVWESFQATPERFVDAGDRVVVVETRRGRGRGSGVDVEQRSAVIWTLRGGQIVRMETDLDPDEALSRVGMAPEP
jgi:ketosteroid isomerase-like protein